MSSETIQGRYRRIASEVKSDRSGLISQLRSAKAVSQHSTTPLHHDAAGRLLTPICGSADSGRLLAIRVSLSTCVKVCGQTILRQRVTDVASSSLRAAILQNGDIPTVLRVIGSEGAEDGRSLPPLLRAISRAAIGAGRTIRNCHRRTSLRLKRHGHICTV